VGSDELDRPSMKREVAMAIEVEGLDTALLESEITRTYSTVATEPDRDFMFPTGRAWAHSPWAPGPGRGCRRHWLGGRNRFARSRPDGRPVRPRRRRRLHGGDGGSRAPRRRRGAPGERDVRRGVAEALPFAEASFDVAISNGVFDLLPDKDVAFAEVFRVLRPGGRLQVADVTIQRPISEESRRNIDLWTG
jgi:SAM-dependent methyltransferase